MDGSISVALAYLPCRTAGRSVEPEGVENGARRPLSGCRALSLLRYIEAQCIVLSGIRPGAGIESTEASDRRGGGEGAEVTGSMSINKDLVAASSTPLVLAILAEGDSYGYAILQRVRELSGGALEWTDGMLYPVLHRLERAGLVESRWEKADSGRRRKYYWVTKAGLEQLADERRQWLTVDETLRRVWSVLAEAASGDGNLVPLTHRS